MAAQELASRKLSEPRGTIKQGNYFQVLYGYHTVPNPYENTPLSLAPMALGLG